MDFGFEGCDAGVGLWMMGLMAGKGVMDDIGREGVGGCDDENFSRYRERMTRHAATIFGRRFMTDR